MVSKMQLHAVGEMCPGYVCNQGSFGISSTETEERITSCETCIHWEKGKCNVNLFDKVLTDLDQT